MVTSFWDLNSGDVIQDLNSSDVIQGLNGGDVNYGLNSGYFIQGLNSGNVIQGLNSGDVIVSNCNSTYITMTFIIFSLFKNNNFKKIFYKCFLIYVRIYLYLNKRFEIYSVHLYKPYFN